VALTDKARQRLEERKQGLILEDVRVGSGPLAAWSRRIKANIEARYADGTIIYEGSMHAYIGMQGSAFIHNSDASAGTLSLTQTSIWLGLNGMAVGGKRRITIGPDSVYGGPFIQGVPGYGGADVRKDTLIVDATLTASCVPVLLRAIHLPTSRYIIEQEIGCRDHDEPRHSSSDPIWKLY